jgi:hypothetical protein
MRATQIRRMLAIAICVLLITMPSYGFQTADSEASPGGAADTAPRSASELRALVAPIALDPDPLVAQILAASTFPDQVAVANYWLQQNKALRGQALAEKVNQQPWDPSVKALTQFPSVLNNLAKNLNWTSSLGEAYHQQPSEVMDAIQTLRAQAKAQGNLKSGPQITVTQPSPDTIVIEPSDPQVVYVPEYDPALVYGAPYVTPDYTAAELATGAALAFAPAIALGAFGAGWGWGWGSWGANWHGGSAVYNRNNFFGNSSWHGGYYNGAYHDSYGYHNAYERPAVSNYRGYANRADTRGREMASNVRNPEMPEHAWAHSDSFKRWNAFGGLGDRFGGGWQSRADSFRGWGSMRAGGFSGGRFGGGHFGGGGFRR